MLLKKMMAKGGIPFKLSILLSLITAIGVLILSNLTLNMFTSSHDEQTKVLGHALAISLETDIQNGFKQKDTDRIQKHVDRLLSSKNSQSQGLMHISVIDAQNRNYLASSLSSNISKRATSALRDTMDNGSDDGTHRQTLVMDINDKNVPVIQFSRKVYSIDDPSQQLAYVQVLFKKDQFFLGNKKYKQNMLLVSSMIVVVIFLGAFVIAASVSRGVKSAAGAISKINEDQFEFYLQTRGDELGNLNRAIENLRDTQKKKHSLYTSGQNKQDIVIQSDETTETKLSQFEATGLHIEMYNLSRFSEKHSINEVVRLSEGLLAYVKKTISTTNGVVEYFNGQMAFITFRGDKQIQDAVKSALQFQYGINQASKELGVKEGEAIEVGLGLHKGMMVTGRIAEETTGFGAAMGSTVQVGLALAKSAAPGEIMVSSRVYGLIKDEYQFVSVNSKLELLKDHQLMVYLLGTKQVDQPEQQISTASQSISEPVTAGALSEAVSEEKPLQAEAPASFLPKKDDGGGIAAMLEETFDDFVVPQSEKEKG